MLITKFNKMIRNRFVWGIFALLICIAFVFSFGSGGCDDSAPRRSNAVARITDQDVSPRELMLARYFEMGLRQDVNIPPEASKMLEERALQRIAKLRMADNLGLTATDAELLEVIQRDPSFQKDGAFQPALYQTTIQRQLGIPVTLFEQYLRQEITLQKLQELSAAFTWTSPTELQQGLRDLTDQRTVEYVVLDRDTFTPQVDISPETAETFFEANTNFFEVPEKVSVKYVRFDIADFTNGVDILETNIVEYYNEHLEDYTSVDTNEETVVTPLEDVSDEIASTLLDEIAVESATSTATTFVVQLVPGGRGNEGMPIEKAAQASGMLVHTTKLFALDEEVPGLPSVDQEFRKAAFALDNSDPVFAVSDAVVQDDAVYVLAYNAREDAHIPPFESVQEDAFSMAQSNALDEAFEARTAEVRESISERLGDGQSLAEAVDEYDVNVVTTDTFSVYSGFEDEATPYAMEIVSSVATIDVGELTEPVPVQDGVLVAHVTSRTPADPATVEMLRDQFATSMTRYRAGMAFRAFEDNVLRMADYKDLIAIRKEAAEAEAETDDD